MTRGPAPAPTVVLRARGSRRVKNRPDEPHPDPGAPPCPRWLSAEAKKKWKHVVGELEKIGVLTHLDGDALGRYCDTWTWWRKCRQFIDENGESYSLKDDAGNVKCFAQFPQVAVCHKLALLLSRLEAEFGFTPASRTRIRAIPKTQAPEGKRRFFKVVA